MKKKLMGFFSKLIAVIHQKTIKIFLRTAPSVGIRFNKELFFIVHVMF